MPWFDLKPQINWEDLPEWNHFVSGKDAKIRNRHQKHISNRNSKYSNKHLTIYI